MTHLNTGHYAAKHSDSQIPETLRQKLISAADNGHLSCIKAHLLAQETGFSPTEIGRAADLLELRLTGCQLGLFGQGRKEKKIEAATTPDPVLCKALADGLKDHRLPCHKAWEIAAHLNLKKTEITAACEALEIKISPCQLGAF